MAGTWAKVLRNVSAVAVVALVAAGCGGTARSHDLTPQGIPRVLAHRWVVEADRIATAVTAGQSCRAAALAGSLRSEIIQAGARVPSRLSPALLEGVNSLADRIVCRPVTQTVTTAPPPKPAPHKHDHHDHHGHGHDKGDKG